MHWVGGSRVKCVVGVRRGADVYMMYTLDTYRLTPPAHQQAATPHFSVIVRLLLWGAGVVCYWCRTGAGEERHQRGRGADGVLDGRHVRVGKDVAEENAPLLTHNTM